MRNQQVLSWSRNSTQFMKPKFQYRTYKSSPTVPMRSQINPTPNLHVTLPSVLLSLRVTAKILHEPLPSLSVLHSPPISFFLLYHPNSISCRVPPYIVFSSPLLLRPTWAQISPSAPYFQTPSVYVLQSERTIFTSIKQQAKLQFCIF